MNKLCYIFPARNSKITEKNLAIYESSDAAQYILEMARETIDDEHELEMPHNSVVINSSACYEAFKEKMGKNLEKLGVPVCGGHSVGFISALYSTEALEFPETIKLSRAREECIRNGGPKDRNYDLLALVSREISNNILNDICSEYECHISLINSDNQIVIAVPIDRKKDVTDFARGHSISSFPLGIGYPLHTQLMEGATEKLEEYLADIEIKPSKYPIYATTEKPPKKLNIENP